MVIKYNSGFNNEFATEALEGALPEGQNSPQKCPYGLYAEQISGTAFTAPRSNNRRTWVYRIRPSVVAGTTAKALSPSQTAPELSRAPASSVFPSVTVVSEDATDVAAATAAPKLAWVSTPAQLRWSPFKLPADGKSVTFVEGLKSVCGAGDPSSRAGLNVLVYAANASMENQAFYSADGDMLIVLQQGRLHIRTELGLIHAEPTEIVVIPRGIKFSVDLPDGPSRGYILETFDRHWELPDLGPIGANGNANPRDFLYPVAAYEDIEATYTTIAKYQGHLFSQEQGHSPFDVVAWHGNLSPFKYDLKKFNVIGSISYDHPDPSIFTVLTVKSGNPGTALADFVVFAPRWLVAENTFRPPWFHHNCMSEFMGLISGTYDAKADGFLPGGASLHSAFTAHGPDSSTFEKASSSSQAPHKTAEDGFAFMFETYMMLSITSSALSEAQQNYMSCWQNMPKNFNPNKK